MAVSQTFVNASTSTTPNQQIALARLASIDKYQIGTDPNNVDSQEVGIRFAMDMLAPVRDLKLVYPGTTADAIILRDASFAAIKAAIAQTTV